MSIAVSFALCASNGPPNWAVTNVFIARGTLIGNPRINKQSISTTVRYRLVDIYRGSSSTNEITISFYTATWPSDEIPRDALLVLLPSVAAQSWDSTASQTDDVIDGFYEVIFDNAKQGILDYSEREKADLVSAPIDQIFEQHRPLPKQNALEIAKTKAMKVGYELGPKVQFYIQRLHPCGFGWSVSFYSQKDIIGGGCTVLINDVGDVLSVQGGIKQGAIGRNWEKAAGIDD
jgi:hypothetical protein